MTFVSDKAIKAIKTKDFIFENNEDCYADFFIRDPKDASPKFDETVGTIGWRVVKRVAFEIDFTEDKLNYPDDTCPYTNFDNRFGVQSLGTTSDAEQALVKFIAPGSAADKAGLRKGDIWQRLTLEDGEIVEKFDSYFNDIKEKHIHAPAGTRTTIEFLRDGREMKVDVINEDIVFTKLTPRIQDQP